MHYKHVILGLEEDIPNVTSVTTEDDKRGDALNGIKCYAALHCNHITFQR